MKSAWSVHHPCADDLQHAGPVQLVEYQAANGWLLLPVWGEGLSWQRWILLVPVAISFIIFLTSIFAEANRTPFDMSECETDLVGGYHTEYSSMKFAQFFMGEYAAMVVGSSLVSRCSWGAGPSASAWTAGSMKT